MEDYSHLAPEVQRTIAKRQKEQGKKDFDWGNTFEGYKLWEDIFNGKDMRGHIRYPKVDVSVDKPKSLLVKTLSFIIGMLISTAMFSQNSINVVMLDSSVTVTRTKTVKPKTQREQVDKFSMHHNKKFNQASAPWIIPKDYYVLDMKGSGGSSFTIVFNNTKK